MGKFKFIDLFCGIGGFHLALSSLGGECVFASDIDADCRKVYQQNFGIEPHGDITKIDEKDIPAHDVLCGGFSCQSFFQAGYCRGKKEPPGAPFFFIVRKVKKHKNKDIFLGKGWKTLGGGGGGNWKGIFYNM